MILDRQKILSVFILESKFPKTTANEHIYVFLEILHPELRFSNFLCYMIDCS